MVADEVNALVIVGAVEPPPLPEELIVRVNVAVPDPALFVALSVTLEVPAAVGVPVIAPVAVSMASPAGKPEALKLIGEFDAVIV